MTKNKDHDGDLSNWLFSRTGIATAVTVAVLAFLIYTGHSAHLMGALPWLLILACPLMHIFMHGGHGGHGREPKETSAGDALKKNEEPHPHGH